MVGRCPMPTSSSVGAIRPGRLPGPGRQAGKTIWETADVSWRSHPGGATLRVSPVGCDDAAQVDEARLDTRKQFDDD
jgi:hypothetical protein